MSLRMSSKPAGGGCGERRGVLQAAIGRRKAAEGRVGDLLSQCFSDSELRGE